MKWELDVKQPKAYMGIIFILLEIHTSSRLPKGEDKGIRLLTATGLNSSWNGLHGAEGSSQDYNWSNTKDRLLETVTCPPQGLKHYKKPPFEYLATQTSALFTAAKLNSGINTS